MKFNNILIGLAIFATVVGIVLAFALDFPNEPEPQVAPKPQATKYEIVKFCQELAATSHEEDWSYKSCLKELQEAVNEDLGNKVETI